MTLLKEKALKNGDRILLAAVVLFGYAALLHNCIRGPFQDVPFAQFWMPSLFFLGTTIIAIRLWGVSLGIIKGKQNAVLGIALVSFVVVVLIVVALFWPEPFGESHTSLGLYQVVLITLIPISEELYFRGFLLDALERVLKKRVWTTLFVSFIFGLVHLPQGQNVALVMFMFSLFLSYTTLATGSLLWAIAAHVAWNGAVVLKETHVGYERLFIFLMTFAIILVVCVQAVRSGKLPITRS